MPETYTKAQIKKMLVDERRKSLSKHKHSKFMSRTLSIYNGQVKRAKEEYKTTPSYTLAEFRELVREALGTPCPYSGDKLSLVNLTADHADPVSRGGSWDIENLEIITKSANWQKGNMTRKEFRTLLRGLPKFMAPEAINAMKRRLSMGGKWLQNGGR